MVNKFPIGVYWRSSLCLATCLLCSFHLSWGQDLFQISFRTQFEIVGPTQLLKYSLLLPPHIEGRQEIEDLSFSPSPHRIYEKNGNRYAEFRIPRPKEDVYILMNVTVRMPEGEVILPIDLTEEELRTYLLPAPYQESRHPEIMVLAAAFKEKSLAETVAGIHAFVQDTLRYQEDVIDDLGAITALQTGVGDCSEFADLFVSLCRAAGIPARTVSGWLLSTKMDNPNHHWAEIWADGKWISIDPSAALNASNPLSNLQLTYLFFSPYRVDKVCKTSNNRWVATGKVKATYTYDIVKQKLK